MKVISARFDGRTIARLDELVEKGVFGSRSEALRQITRDYIDRHFQPLLWGEAGRGAEEDLEDAELEEACARLFSGDFTAAEMVAEGRGR